MHGPLDWISRVVMLVLAGMVSLSIIGSIAAIPSGTIESRIGLDRPPPLPEDAPQPESSEPPAIAPGQGAPSAPEASTPAAAGTAAPRPEESDAERWLEAITYALLALVGMAALIALILWRGLRERRRIADALEAIAGRPL